MITRDSDGTSRVTMARRMTEAVGLPLWAHDVPARSSTSRRTRCHTALYVCLQDEDKIVTFTMDAATGQLTPQAGVPVAGDRPCRRSARTGTCCMSGSADSPPLRASDRPRHRRAHAPGDGRGDPRAHVSGPRPHGPVFARRITKAGCRRSIPSVRTAR